MQIPTDEEIRIEEQAGQILLELQDPNLRLSAKVFMLRWIESEHSREGAEAVRDQNCPEVQF